MFLRVTFSLVLWVLTCVAFSQPSLEFNGVRVIVAADGTVAVPAGKVWKIEGVFYSSTVPEPICPGSSTCTSLSHSDVIQVNSANVQVRAFRNRGAAYSGSTFITVHQWEQKFPMWLKAGNTLAVGTGVSSISVIEFNVTE